jgi:hypothetical protein
MPLMIAFKPIVGELFMTFNPKWQSVRFSPTRGTRSAPIATATNLNNFQYLTASRRERCLTLELI